MYVVVHYLLTTRVYEPSCQLVGTVVASASVAKKEEKKKKRGGMGKCFVTASQNDRRQYRYKYSMRCGVIYLQLICGDGTILSQAWP
jgi:hypothetical protein